MFSLSLRASVVDSVDFYKFVGSGNPFLCRIGLGEATLIEAGVTVTWPDALSFEIPGCTATPILSESTSYVTSKIFYYAYPDACTPVASSEVAAQAVVTVSKNGTVASITDSTSTVSAQTFTTTGSWTAPSGVTSVTVECWGGGGAYSRKTPTISLMSSIEKKSKKKPFPLPLKAPKTCL